MPAHDGPATVKGAVRSAHHQPADLDIVVTNAPADPMPATASREAPVEVIEA